MRALMGWLMFLLAVAFATCLVRTLILNTWFDLPAAKTVIGFFGFGIPTVIAGVATGFLWDDYASLQSLLGWASTMTAIVCGVAVLFLVGGWVLSNTAQAIVGPLIWHVLGFGVCALVCGAFGIMVLYQAEGKTG